MNDKNDALEELADYLPNSFKTQTEGEYMAFLSDAFNDNYTNDKYEFASLAFHLLYMSFVSFSIWQIRLVREQDFKHALIGFQSDAENKLMGADSPFKFYDQLKESQIFRFLKLVGCANNQVGEFAKFVKRRNKIAHPGGSIFFNDKQTIDDEIAEMMKEVVKIQEHMRPIILEVYRRFLIDSSDFEAREYVDPHEELIAALIHRNYISQKDIETCLSFDLTALTDQPQFENMNELHDALRAIF